MSHFHRIKSRPPSRKSFHLHIHLFKSIRVWSWRSWRGWRLETVSAGLWSYANEEWLSFTVGCHAALFHACGIDTLMRVILYRGKIVLTTVFMGELASTRMRLGRCLRRTPGDIARVYPKKYYVGVLQANCVMSSEIAYPSHKLHKYSRTEMTKKSSNSNLLAGFIKWYWVDL